VHLPAEEREAFFDRHCRDEPGVRAELESLLAHDDEETKGFLQSPVQTEGDREATRVWPAGGAPTEDGAAASMPEAVEHAPERIGRYLVRKKIGEGGMGSVYLAEQRHPVRREVAVKLVKPGMASAEVLARFARERETLELLDHPGIARILDAGTTAEGAPFFVMEYAPGLPLDQYCDREELDVKQRLSLFCQVCEAVQYAHQKGILHRDLKPGNLLVTDAEHGPRVRVIDFGIAVALREDAADQERATAAHQVLGTRHYMSPEQSDPERAAGVDTRSDVYSLGVVLYDLLVGVLPFDSRDPSPAAAEATPVPPSRRFSCLGEESTRIAEERRTSPGAHARRLSGDLDWITLRAMEWDPARRYASASELGGDVRRHLLHEPVLAGPPELSYVLSKFLRRHRTLVVAAGLALAALLVGTAGLAFGLLEAATQRDEAIEAGKRLQASQAAEEERRLEAESALAQAEAARAEREHALALAEKRSADAQAVTDFLVETVALADLEVSLEPDLNLEHMLRRAGERVMEAFAHYPEGEVAVRGALGRAFHSMGRLDDAEEHLRRAYDLEAGLVATPRAQLYATMRRLSEVFGGSDSHADAELRARTHELALSLVEEDSPLLGGLLRRFDERARRGDTPPPPEELAALQGCASDELPEDAPTWLVLADALEYLGYQLAAFGEDEQAVPLLELTLQIRRAQLAPVHPEIARSLGILVSALTAVGRARHAEELVRESIEIYSAALPREHWLLAEAHSLLGETLDYQRDGAGAERLLLESHETIIEARGLASRPGVLSAFRLANHYELYGDPDAADAYRAELRDALAHSQNQPWRWGAEEAAFGPQYGRLLFALGGLDEALHEAGHVEEGLPDPRPYESALDQLLLEWDVTTDGASSVSLILARWLADYPFYPGELDPELVRRVQGRILSVLESYGVEFLRPVVRCHLNLFRLEQAEGNGERAEACLRQALVAARGGELLGPLRIDVERQLAEHLAAEERFLEAEEMLLSTWEAAAVHFGVSHRRTREAVRSLLQLYDLWGRPLRAAPCLARHLDGGTAADQDPERLAELAWFVLRSEGFETELYRRALAAAERAAALSPDAEERRSLVGIARVRLGEFEEAQELLEGCTELIERDDLRHGAFRTILRIRLGRFEEAELLAERLESAAEGVAGERRRLLDEVSQRLARGR